MAARVPYVEREKMDAEGKEIYDRIRRDRNVPEVGLQFRALLNNPRAAGHLTSMGAELRFHSAIPEKHLDRGMPDNLHDGLSIDAGIC